MIYINTSRSSFCLLQGIKWVKQRYAENLITVRLGSKGYLDRIEHAVMSGDVVLIENIEESIDPVLDPLLGRNLIKKGRYIKMGDKEVEYNKAFKLILQTKVSYVLISNGRTTSVNAKY